MKTRLRSFITTIALVLGAVPALRAAEQASASKEEKKGLRVLAAPDRERRVLVQNAEKRTVEKETVAFLGVETSPVSAALTAQLGLPRGTGLVVNHVVPKSAAADVLKPHDILIKFEDQILIEVRQLSVLIRNHKEGEEVTLTYLRGGQKNTAKVKLGKQEIPKITTLLEGARVPLVRAFEGDKFELFTPDVDRADVDRLLSMIQRAPNGDPVRIQIDRSAGPGFRAMTVHTGNSNLVFSDDEGSLELTIKDGAKTLVAKNAKGEQLFSGPVTTPEERKALPDRVRERLEKLEGMHNITFHTDGDFKGAETHVIRPRGIGLPLPHRLGPRQQSLFY
jgi:serine protease Do